MEEKKTEEAGSSAQQDTAKETIPEASTLPRTTDKEGREYPFYLTEILFEKEEFHRNLSFILDYGAAFGNLLAICPPIPKTMGLCVSTSLSGISMVGSLFSPYYDESTSKLLKTADASLGLFIPIVNMCAANAELPENKERLNTLALTLTIAKIGVSTTIHRQKEKALKDKTKKKNNDFFILGGNALLPP